jgi:KDO2-lipid IV(A) lauroyltransferase
MTNPGEGRKIVTKSSSESASAAHPLKIKHVHEYLAASLLSSVVRSLSDRQTEKLSRNLGRFVSRRWHSRRAIAQSNLERAFSHLSAVEIEELTTHVFQSAAQSFLEFARISKITPSRLDRMVEVDPASRSTFASQRKPVIFVSAHLGNWEYLGRWLAEHHGPIALLINPQTNPLVDRMIMGWRAHPRLHFVPYRSGWSQLSKLLQSGMSVALLADQRLDSGGVELPFFGCTTRWSKLPALLASRHQVPLVPIFLPRLTGNRFQLLLNDKICPIPDTAVHDETIRLTQAYVTACEQVIREYPAQYLFTHNRWGIGIGQVSKQVRVDIPESPSASSLQRTPSSPLSIR